MHKVSTKAYAKQTFFAPKMPQDLFLLQHTNPAISLETQISSEGKEVSRCSVQMHVLTALLMFLCDQPLFRYKPRGLRENEDAIQWK